MTGVSVMVVVIAGVFFGDGVGGSTDGSLARNDLTGVLGLDTSVRCFRTTDFEVVGEALSSGNSCRFNRRRTA